MSFPNPDFFTWYHVDDDPDDLSIYADFISEYAPQVNLEQFSSSMELIRRLNTTRNYPRILLIDLNMPILDGLGCLRHVRILPHVSTFTRLVMLSTTSSPEMIEMCRNAGAHFYAVKPSGPEGIRQLIETLVEICQTEYVWPVSKSRFLLTTQGQ
ncbi:response regulator [Flavobacterium silvaticum]|uniref:Response regulator n=1 Tax=Flavobacterium silvaticum TaxID=1852020 RepID=A0A972FIE5_9FLAO|nr:response regulator [Flavobacterium silvaticum]NMH26574.1 response regulator [Flavobacterium silvaticum]